MPCLGRLCGLQPVRWVDVRVVLSTGMLEAPRLVCQSVLNPLRCRGIICPPPKATAPAPPPQASAGLDAGHRTQIRCWVQLAGYAGRSWGPVPLDQAHRSGKQA